MKKTKNILLVFLVMLALTMPFRCLAQQFTVSFSPTNILDQETGQVSWTATASADTWWDWIGVYPAGDPLSVRSIYTIRGQHSGSFPWVFETAGDQVLQYMDAWGAALSDPLIVSVQTNVNAYVLTISNSRVPINTQFLVSFQSKTNLDIAGDVVGYFLNNNTVWGAVVNISRFVFEYIIAA